MMTLNQLLNVLAAVTKVRTYLVDNRDNVLRILDVVTVHELGHLLENNGHYLNILDGTEEVTFIASKDWGGIVIRVCIER